MDNEDKRKEITECAYKITAAYNTWDNRAEEILEIYNAVSSI